MRGRPLGRGQDQHAGRCHVGIVVVEVLLVPGAEVIDELQAPAVGPGTGLRCRRSELELDHGVAVIWRRGKALGVQRRASGVVAERAVTGLEKEIAARIDDHRPTGLPCAAVATVGGRVEYARQRERRRIVRENPAMIRPIVAVRRERQHDLRCPIGAVWIKRYCGPIHLPQRVESNHAADAAVARAVDRRAADIVVAAVVLRVRDRDHAAADACLQ